MFIFKSLFSRTVVLFSAVMLTSIIIYIMVFWLLFMQPLAQATANHVSQHIYSIQEAINVMDEEDQHAYINGIKDQGVLFVKVGDNNRPGSLAFRLFHRIVQDGIRNRLNNEVLPIRFEFNYLESNQPNVIWIRVELKENFFWVGYPLIASNKPLRQMFVTQLIAIILLTVFSSLIIARSIKKPLSQLVYAANELRVGKIPHPIDESGPEELRVMAKTFNKMARNLQKSMEERNLMLAGISHDLRTPLARIRLALEILNDQSESDLDYSLIDDVEIIDTILGQFLTFADNGENEPAELGDLNAVVKHVVDRYREGTKKFHLRLNDIPVFPFKKIAIQRLLMNLLNNAYEYGGNDICIVTEQNGNQLILSILDNGNGISELDIDELKKPFRRSSSSRSNPQVAGLG